MTLQDKINRASRTLKRGCLLSKIDRIDLETEADSLMARINFKNSQLSILRVNHEHVCRLLMDDQSRQRADMELVTGKSRRID